MSPYLASESAHVALCQGRPLEHPARPCLQCWPRPHASIAAAEDAVEAVTRIYNHPVQTAADPALLADRWPGAIDLEAASNPSMWARAYSDATAAGIARLFGRCLFDMSLRLELASGWHKRSSKLVIFRTRSPRQWGYRGSFSRITETTGAKALIDWRMRPCGAQLIAIYDLAQATTFRLGVAAAGID